MKKNKKILWKTKKIEKKAGNEIFLLKRLLFTCTIIICINLSAISQIKVAGTVSDDTGETIPGVGVSVKGTTIGA